MLSSKDCTSPWNIEASSSASLTFDYIEFSRGLHRSASMRWTPLVVFILKKYWSLLTAAWATLKAFGNTYSMCSELFNLKQQEIDNRLNFAWRLCLAILSVLALTSKLTETISLLISRKEWPALSLSVLMHALLSSWSADSSSPYNCWNDSECFKTRDEGSWDQSYQMTARQIISIRCTSFQL